MRRHPEISLRKCQLLEKVRKEVTQEKTNHWFTEVEKYLGKNHLKDVKEDVSRVFNCDESAFFFAPSKYKVLIPRTELTAYSVTGNSKKENLTVLLGSNAAGTLMPPMVVYKYEHLPDNIVGNVPKG